MQLLKIETIENGYVGMAHKIQYVNSVHNEDCERIIKSFKLVTCSKCQTQVSLVNNLQYIMLFDDLRNEERIIWVFARFSFNFFLRRLVVVVNGN
jgi:hypothetical protein